MTKTAETPESDKAPKVPKPRADRSSKIAQMEAELLRLKKLDAEEKQREAIKAKERTRAAIRKAAQAQKIKDDKAIVGLSALLKKHKLHRVPLDKWTANLEAIAKVLA
jgi:hypothetical protein